MKKFSFFTLTFLMIFSMNKSMAQNSTKTPTQVNSNITKNSKADLENILYIDLTYGRVVIEMLPKVATAVLLKKVML